jgi:hypothetical protein
MTLPLMLTLWAGINLAALLFFARIAHVRARESGVRRAS